MRNNLILQFFELAILMISEYSQKRTPIIKIQDIGPSDPASLHQRAKANVKKNT